MTSSAPIIARSRARDQKIRSGQIHFDVTRLYSVIPMSRPGRGDTLSLGIDDLAFGGEGVGRVDGYVVFVRAGVPGDRLRVRLVEARPRFARGVIEAIDMPSPDRVEAPSPYFHPSSGRRLPPHPY